MHCIPPEVVSQILACLSASEIASLVSCGRQIHALATATGCVSTSSRFVKPVYDAASYDSNKNLLLAPAIGTAGAVTFRSSMPDYRSHFLRKTMLQILLVQGERDAAQWLAHSWNTKLPFSRSAAGTMSLFRDLSWDFVLYTLVCNAFDVCPFNQLHLNVRSVPAIQNEHEDKLPVSSQAFLCNFLCNVAHKDLHLNLWGSSQESPFIAVSEHFMLFSRMVVDKYLTRTPDPNNIDLYPLSDFRSSTIAFGRVLASANPRLRSLELSSYAFDELFPSEDVMSLASYLRWGRHELMRVRLHGIEFGCGEELCFLLRALCKIKSLRSLRLSNVECMIDPPEDPLAILFEEGQHIWDLRLTNVGRVPSNVPFHLVEPPGYRSLGLSQMFLDTSNLQSLLSRMPLLTRLVCLDLSCNGIDGSVLKLFAKMLMESGCNLQRLKLSSNIITGSSVPYFCQALSINKSLRSLDLGDNFIGTTSAFGLIHTLLWTPNNVKFLNLEGNQVRYRIEDLYRLLLACPKGPLFRQVSLRGNPRVESDYEEEVYVQYKHSFKQHYNLSLLF